MLIQQHPDQQRERVGLQQSVGLRILDQLQFSHAGQSKTTRRRGSL